MRMEYGVAESPIVYGKEVIMLVQFCQAAQMNPANLLGSKSV